SGAVLCVRPLRSGRDYHALHRQNSAFRFEPESTGRFLTWRPYDGAPAIDASAHAHYQHDPTWHRGRSYCNEQERRLDYVEDLAAPGCFRWQMDGRDAVLLLSGDKDFTGKEGEDALSLYEHLREAENQRRQPLLTDPMDRAGESYLVRRGTGKTI